MNASPADSRVLIVEDAPANIQALTAILREKGYAISIATNGRQALDVLASVRPDLILLDVMMPGENGFDLTAALRSQSDVPILLLTARGEANDRINGLEKGSVDAEVGKEIDQSADGMTASYEACGTDFPEPLK